MLDPTVAPQSGEPAAPPYFESSSSKAVATEENQAASEPSAHPHPTNKQERTKWTTHDVAVETFRTSSSSSTHSIVLTTHHFTSWVDVLSSDLMHLASKTAKAQAKTQARIGEEVELRHYLNACWGQVKENFHQLLKSLQQGKKNS